MELDQLNIEKIRNVEVVASRHSISFTYTAYDEGEELYKVEDGMVWVKHMAFVRHPEESYKAEWKLVLPEKVADKVIIKNWVDNKILSEHPIKST
ncbi:MAG: hypothetical protein IBX50_15740 [Marinospirillum sp.]|uniref:hypothetical protein n=1 Tax=Marinospirillum sp. TaxID=2183934 RepID=UPI001A0BEC76|nr:hypothetical protein [Marinospirillum sp.]MBE0508141.1 hypothetical protein [Marinospirillum sp.]